MRYDDIENGMVLYREEPDPIVHTCPVCGADWEECDDNGATLYVSDDCEMAFSEYPIRDGFCPVCALSEAKLTDLTQFVRESGYVRDFMTWLVDGKAEYTAKTPDYDATFVFDLLERTEPELIEQRLQEYIGDSKACRNEFREWRM